MKLEPQHIEQMNQRIIELERFIENEKLSIKRLFKKIDKKDKNKFKIIEIKDKILKMQDKIERFKEILRESEVESVQV
jgi:hypothetical protein